MSTTTSQSNPARSWTSRLRAISVTVSCLSAMLRHQIFHDGTRDTSLDGRLLTNTRRTRMYNRVALCFARTCNEPLKYGRRTDSRLPSARSFLTLALVFPSFNERQKRKCGWFSFRNFVSVVVVATTLWFLFIVSAMQSVQTYSGNRYCRKPIQTRTLSFEQLHQFLPGNVSWFIQQAEKSPGLVPSPRLCLIDFYRLFFGMRYRDRVPVLFSLM